MPKIAYKEFRFRPDTLKTIERVNNIVEEYAADGFDLTLRQVYYQFVSRGWIANTEREYKKLGSVVNDGRLAGMIDWQHIVDRTREIEVNPHWSSPESIMRSAAQSFAFDKWDMQPWRPEVWIEKDALKGVFAGVCRELDVPLLSCRGYTSQSEMWAGGRRLKRHLSNDQTPLILHFGDHDPSGIDMTRDIGDRLEMFMGMGGVELKRLALNMDQVYEYGPPPNPAKVTDSRFEAYLADFGEESWELDALEPRVLVDLARQTILEYRDEEAWEAAAAEEEAARLTLSRIADRWADVGKFLSE